MVVSIKATLFRLYQAETIRGHELPFLRLHPLKGSRKGSGVRRCPSTDNPTGRYLMRMAALIVESLIDPSRPVTQLTDSFGPTNLCCAHAAS